MSSADESAIDAMVGEVMAGRAAVEAAVAPAAAASPPEIPDDQPESPSMTIGYVDGDPSSNNSPESAGDQTSDLEQLRAERDSYLADSQRLAADFANFRKQSEKRVADTAATQSAGLVRSLLPVLDACDSALDLEPDSAVAPIRSALLSELERNGLELLAPSPDEPFDPEKHDAVMHEQAAADATHDGPVVREVLRAGYLWKGRVVRPAMVKVVG